MTYTGHEALQHTRIDNFKVHMLGVKVTYVQATFNVQVLVFRATYAQTICVKVQSTIRASVRTHSHSNGDIAYT
jgi:hypothetical protein